MGKATNVYLGSTRFCIDFGAKSLHLFVDTFKIWTEANPQSARALTPLLRGRVALMQFTCRVFHLN